MSSVEGRMPAVCRFTFLLRPIKKAFGPVSARKIVGMFVHGHDLASHRFGEIQIYKFFLGVVVIKVSS